MRRIVTALGVACAVTLAGAPPAQAIGTVTGDAEPDFDHPYVGIVVLFDAAGAPVQRCTGSLLTDTVFLTAGHCVTIDDEGTPASSARIWFEQDAGADFDPATGQPAASGFPVSGGVTASTMHRYGPGESAPPQTWDAGLVVLDQPVTDVYPDLTDYASLAGPGTLEEYADADGEATMTISGYGVSSASDNSDELVDRRSRLMTKSDISGLNTPGTGPYNVELAGSEGHDTGGACYGDSGGPLLIEGTDVAAAVVSTGTAGCDGPFFSYRTDTEPVLGWILEQAGSEAEEIDIADLAVVS